MNKRVAFDMKEPCTSCPYRRDAKLEHWAREEFQRLLDHEAAPLPGAIYACHGTAKTPKKRVCAGWLLNQRERRFPSIALRMRLYQDETAMQCAHDVQASTPQYDTVEEMVRANYPDEVDDWIEESEEKARRFTALLRMDEP